MYIESLGQQLLGFMGDKYESGVYLVKPSGKKAIKKLTEIIVLLNTERAVHKFDKIDNALTVKMLFTVFSRIEAPQASKTINNAHSMTVIHFFEWLLEKWKQRAQQMSPMEFNKYIIRQRETVKNVLFDLGRSHFFSERLFSHHCGRNLSHKTDFHFYCCWRVYLLGEEIIDHKTREQLSIFGFRQALENRFKEIIGYCGAQSESDTFAKSMLRISHDVMPDAIRVFEKQINWRTEQRITLRQLQKIYSWSNIPIHNMMSTYVWVLWKAYSCCEFIFDRPVIDYDTLMNIRKHLLDQIKPQVKKLACAERVYFIVPENVCIQNGADKPIKYSVLLSTDGSETISNEL